MQGYLLSEETLLFALKITIGNFVCYQELNVNGGKWLIIYIHL